ncbi:MAG TPA: IS66 family transposase [Gemmatimonadales bacterium]|jgi:transposase|nr:IS66 family transposase [Gemmatimonadales bacterium]
MSAKDSVRCTNCQRLQARVDALESELAALKQVVARLGQQLAAARKDSSTSSRPPSSDIVKPPKPPPPVGQDKRRIGGQPGHPKHQRAAFPPEALNGGSIDHRLDSCPGCGHDLRPALTIAPRVVQQVDVREVPLSIQEHRTHPGWCPSCRKMYEAPLPPGIERGGLVGPTLTTLIAYLKGACHASYSTVRKLLRDVVGVTISRGELARIIGKVSRALERPYEQLLDDLPGQARLNVDETGHKQNGDRQWTWCFRAALYTLFKIDPTRSGDVLIEVLGAEFDGVLGCDYFSSYRRYHRECGVLLQFCLAHLIRDVKYLTTLPDARDRASGAGLCEALRELFAVIHRRERLSAELFQSQLEAARAEVLRRGTSDVPETKHSRNLAKRFEAHGASYFRFVTEPGLEPTNNLAEQAIRFVVIDRLITQGTRSEAGNRWCERIWTVIATCVQQGRSVFAYLEAAVGAWFEGAEAPALLPEG